MMIAVGKLVSLAANVETVPMPLEATESQCRDTEATNRLSTIDMFSRVNKEPALLPCKQCGHVEARTMVVSTQ